MPNVRIVKVCHFTHDDGHREIFVPGDYDLPAELADHWFIQAHSDKPPRVPPRAGSPDYAYRMAAYEAEESDYVAREKAFVQEAADRAREEFRAMAADEREKRMPGEREDAENEDRSSRPTLRMPGHDAQSMQHTVAEGDQRALEEREEARREA